MRKRALGKTGLYVSQIGLGTWPLAGNAGLPGYGELDSSSAEATVKKALDAGVTFFDTADVYGDGYAESLLGRLLERETREVSICTKGGLDLATGEFNAAPKFLERQFNASRDRLRKDRIDVYLLHNPPQNLLGLRELYRPLIKLRDWGLVDHIGVSVSLPAEAWLMLDRPEVEIIQVPFNFLYSDIDNGLLTQLCCAGKGILVREALANGLLTGKYESAVQLPGSDFRSQAPDQLFQAVSERMTTFNHYRRNEESWVDFALRFVLDRPEVFCVVVGARRPEHISAFFTAGQIKPSPMVC